MAIALLTNTVRLFLIPLTTKQVKSQQAMQRIQPEMKRLQAKYKNYLLYISDATDDYGCAVPVLPITIQKILIPLPTKIVKS